MACLPSAGILHGPGRSTTGGSTAMRRCAFRLFIRCPNLVKDIQTEAVLGVSQKRFRDSESVLVHHDLQILRYSSQILPNRSVMQLRDPRNQCLREGAIATHSMVADKRAYLCEVRPTLTTQSLSTTFEDEELTKKNSGSSVRVIVHILFRICTSFRN
jgi:hypothetical protein